MSGTVIREKLNIEIYLVSISRSIDFTDNYIKELVGRNLENKKEYYDLYKKFI